MSARLATNDLEAFWMPFTANRQYRKAPRLFVRAQGTHFTTDDGRSVIDAGNERAEPSAIIGDSTDRSAAEIDAVIAAFTSDQPETRTVAFCAMVGQRYLESGLHRFRA